MTARKIAAWCFVWWLLCIYRDMCMCSWDKSGRNGGV